MKKQTRLLLLIGTLSMSFTIFTRAFITVPQSITDFLKGFGVAIIFGAFILEVRRKKNCAAKVQSKNNGD